MPCVDGQKARASIMRPAVPPPTGQGTIAPPRGRAAQQQQQQPHQDIPSYGFLAHLRNAGARCATHQHAAICMPNQAGVPREAPSIRPSPTAGRARTPRYLFIPHARKHVCTCSGLLASRLNTRARTAHELANMSIAVGVGAETRAPF